MATKFMAGKRIIGNKSDRDGLTDFNDTLESSADGSNSGITLKLGGETLKGTPDSTSLVSNTTGWTLQSGSGSYLSLDSTNNELDITMGENADHCAYFDLGSGSVSDTKWTLRFKYQIRTYTASSSGQFAIGLSSSTNSLISNNQNFIIFSNTVTSSLNRWRGHGDVNDKQSAGQGASLLTGTMGTSSGVSTKYYEIAKLSTGHIRCRIYNDSSYTTLDSEAEDTSSDADGDPTGLRYIQFALYDEGTVPTYTASLSNVEFYNNSANLSDSKLGSGAYSFDGSNDRVTTDQRVNGLHDGTGGSVALWVKPTSSADNDIIFNTHNGSGSGVGVEIKFDSSNRIKVASTNSSNGWVTANSTTALSNGTWYHVAVTLDTDTKYRIYINGTLEATSSAFTPKTANSTNPYYLGDSPDSGNYYDGVLDDVGIYSRVLSATEIGKLANNNIDGSDGWVSVAGSSSTKNITVDASNQELDFKFYGGSANGNGSVAYVDVGAGEISETDWALQFTINYSTQVGNQGVGWVGLSDSIANSTTAQDGVNIVFMNNDNQVFGKALNGQTPNDNWGTGTSATLSTDTPYYITIKRTDASNGTIDIKTGSHSGSSLTNYPADIASLSSSVTGLRYIKVMDREGYSSTTNGDVGTIKDIKFWKNTDDTSTTPTSTYSFTAGNPQLVSSLSNTAGLKAYYSMDTQTENTIEQTQCGSNRTVMGQGNELHYGIKINTGSALIGKTISNVHFRLKMNNNPASENLVYCRVYRGSSFVHTFGTTDPDNISIGSYTWYNFGTGGDFSTSSDGSVTLQSGDRIVITWDRQHSGNHSDYLNVEYKNADVYDGTNTCETVYQSNWSDNTSRDPTFKLTEAKKCPNNAVKVYPKIEDEMLFSENDTGNDYIWDSTTNTWTKII